MSKAEILAGQIDALAALRAEKARVQARANASGRRIGRLGQQLVSPGPAAGGLFGMGQLLSGGMAVYQGVRMGARVVGFVSKFLRRR